MLGDIFTKVSTAQNLAGAGTIVSTDSIDMLAARDMGPGREVKLVVHVPTTIVMNASSASLEIQAIVADDAALTANVTVVGRSAAILKATLLAGRAPIEVKINQDYNSIGRRFLGARYVPNDAAAMTSGAITAMFAPLSDSGDGGKLYPSGFPIP